MANNTIITIARQYGSGGHDIGKKLAEELKIPFYDKELLERAAKDSGFCQEIFENYDEKPTNSFLYSLVMDTYSMGYSTAAFAEMPLNHKIFLAQFNAIKDIAKEGPCVIVGRCADYALADFPNVVNVYLYADLQSRIARIARRHDVTDAKAKDLIVKTDKKRSSYYNYYTNKKWSDAESYELCLNSAELGVEGTAKMIEQYVMMKESIPRADRKI